MVEVGLKVVIILVASKSAFELESNHLDDDDAWS